MCEYTHTLYAIGISMAVFLWLYVFIFLGGGVASNYLAFNLGAELAEDFSRLSSAERDPFSFEELRVVGRKERRVGMGWIVWKEGLQMP